jgi:hypothetical protein
MVHETQVMLAQPGGVSRTFWPLLAPWLYFAPPNSPLGPSAMITQKFSFQSDSTGLHLVLLLLLLLLLHLHRHITNA